LYALLGYDPFGLKHCKQVSLIHNKQPLVAVGVAGSIPDGVIGIFQ